MVITFLSGLKGIKLNLKLNKNNGRGIKFKKKRSIVFKLCEVEQSLTRFSTRPKILG